MNLKNKVKLFCTCLPKTEGAPCMEKGNFSEKNRTNFKQTSRDIVQIREECFLNITWTRPNNKSFREFFAAPEPILNFNSPKKNKSLPSAINVLYQQRKPKPYDKIGQANLGELCCFWRTSKKWATFSSKNDSNYLHVKPTVSNEVDKNNFRLLQNIIIEESGFNQFRGFVSQQAIAAKLFVRRGTSVPSADTNNGWRHGWTNQTGSPGIWHSGPSKEKDNMLRYNMHKAENSFAKVQFFPRKEEEAKFQQFVHTSYEHDELIYLLDKLNSV